RTRSLRRCSRGPGPVSSFRTRQSPARATRGPRSAAVPRRQPPALGHPAGNPKLRFGKGSGFARALFRVQRSSTSHGPRSIRNLEGSGNSPLRSSEKEGDRTVRSIRSLMARRRDGDEGFTLIELMVVVLIIAILIAIAIPTFLGARQRAQNRAAQSSLRNG